MTQTPSPSSRSAAARPGHQKSLRQRKQILGADKTVTTWTAVGVLVLVFGILAWGVVDLVQKDPHVFASVTSQVLTLVGFLLGGGALAVTLLIYQVQKQENEEDRTSNQAHGEAVLEGVAEVKELLTFRQAQQAVIDLRQVDAVDDPVKASEQDPYEDGITVDTIPAEELAAIGAPTEPVERFKVYSPGQVPIRVLADLSTGWAEKAERGELDLDKVTGWEAGEAVAYRRRKQGNHAWFVRMTDQNNPDNTYLWQVSRGGQKKPGPTIKQLSP